MLLKKQVISNGKFYAFACQMVLYDCGWFFYFPWLFLPLELKENQASVQANRFVWCGLFLVWRIIPVHAKPQYDRDVDRPWMSFRHQFCSWVKLRKWVDTQVNKMISKLHAHKLLREEISKYSSFPFLCYTKMCDDPRIGLRVSE